MKAAFLIPVLFLMTIISSRAQVRYGATAGAGYAYAATHNTGGGRFTASFRPNFDLFLMAPLSPAFSFQTGLGFKTKGFAVTSVLSDDQMQSRDIYRVTARYDYLQVPAMVVYRYQAGKQHQFHFGAGMYYGFMLRGQNDIRHQYYSGDDLVETTTYSSRLRTGLTRSGVESPPGKRTNLLLIDCGIKLQLNYVWRDHFMTGIFHERSFYDIRADNDGQSSIKMRYTGFSLGYIF